MAPVLQCPECGTKHPLDAVGDRTAFPCDGCGRILKVPEQARTAVAASPPSAPAPLVPPGPASALFDHDTTHVFAGPLATAAPTPAPVTPPVPPPGPAPSARPRAARPGGTFDPVPGRLLRFALWFVAVPLGFLIVFAFARLFGVLNSNQLEDVWLATGWGRFTPIARLLPFVALATAAIVHGSVLGITELRRRRHAPTPAGARSPARDQSIRPPVSRTGS